MDDIDTKHGFGDAAEEIDIVHRELSHQRKARGFGIRDDDLTGVVAIELCCDLGKRGAVEDEHAFPPSELITECFGRLLRNRYGVGSCDSDVSGCQKSGGFASAFAVQPRAAFHQRNDEVLGTAAYREFCAQIGNAMAEGSDHEGVCRVVPDLEEGLAFDEPDRAGIFFCDLEHGVGVEFDLRAVRQRDDLATADRGGIGGFGWGGVETGDGKCRRTGGEHEACGQTQDVLAQPAGRSRRFAHWRAQGGKTISAGPGIVQAQIGDHVRSGLREPRIELGLICMGPVAVLLAREEARGSSIQRIGACPEGFEAGLAHGVPPPLGSLLKRLARPTMAMARYSLTVSTPMPIRAEISRMVRPSIFFRITASRHRGERCSSADCSWRNSWRAMVWRSGPGRSSAISSSSRSATASIETICSRRIRSITRFRAVVIRNGRTGSGIFFCAASYTRT